TSGNIHVLARLQGYRNTCTIISSDMKARGIADFYSAAHNLLGIALQKAFCTKLQQLIPVHQQKRLRFVISDCAVLLIEPYGLGVHAKEMSRFLSTEPLLPIADVSNI